MKKNCNKVIFTYKNNVAVNKATVYTINIKEV